MHHAGSRIGSERFVQFFIGRRWAEQGFQIAEFQRHHYRPADDSGPVGVLGIDRLPPETERNPNVHAIAGIPGSRHGGPGARFRSHVGRRAVHLDGKIA